MPTPAHARRFIEVLTAKAPSLQWQAGSRTAAAQGGQAPAAGGSAKTFAIDDAPMTTSDTTF
jgi:hypothetical protein